MRLAEVNAMAQPDFVANFGDVAEHSPWVAERAEVQRPFASVDAMVAAFQTAIRDAPEAEQLRLICAHPDLAGRAAMAEESRKEQAGAGLNQLSPEEFARFTDLNSRYKERLRHSLHPCRQGRHDAPDPRQLRCAASATTVTPNWPPHSIRSAASSASALPIGSRHNKETLPHAD
jgi:OHCU decarboxylase